VVKKAFFIIIILVIGIIGWYLLSPLVINRTVNDKLETESVEPKNEKGADFGPMIVSAGEFTGADSFHQASGKAEIVKTESGYALQLVGFEVTNGPDLFVTASFAASPRSKSELQGGTYLEIARLKGNRGNQLYSLPSDFRPDDFNSIVIYCKAFSVIFGWATLN
jgi:hypothetical protein